MKVKFGCDPFWGDTIKTYHTSCAECGRFLRLQSENARNPDGTKRRPPNMDADYFCASCKIRRLL